MSELLFYCYLTLYFLNIQINNRVFENMFILLKFKLYIKKGKLIVVLRL